MVTRWHNDFFVGLTHELTAAMPQCGGACVQYKAMGAGSFVCGEYTWVRQDLLLEACAFPTVSAILSGFLKYPLLQASISTRIVALLTSCRCLDDFCQRHGS